MMKEQVYSDKPLLSQPAVSLKDYQDAIAGKGPKAHDWSDKPHRLVYDLCREVATLRRELFEK